MDMLASKAFGFSILGLALLSTYFFYKNRNTKSLIISLCSIVIAGSVYYKFFFTPDIVTKGNGENELYFIIVLYICMLLGMIAHYLYNLFSTPKGLRKSFDFGLFICPVFASPIVFLPLLTAFQNAEVDLTNLTLPKFMIFFIAFENGFFWREIFINRQKEVQNA